jgi:hypothetical protein
MLQLQDLAGGSGAVEGASVGVICCSLKSQGHDVFDSPRLWFGGEVFVPAEALDLAGQPVMPRRYTPCKLSALKQSIVGLKTPAAPESLKSPVWDHPGLLLCRHSMFGLWHSKARLSASPPSPNHRLSLTTYAPQCLRPHHPLNHHPPSTKAPRPGQGPPAHPPPDHH